MSFNFLFFLAVTVLQAVTGNNSYGDVDFETSCLPDVRADFNTALSMMYSFWYSEALNLFDDVLSRDPQCCMVRL